MKVPVEHQEVGLQLKKPGIDEQGQDEHWKVVLGAGEGGNSTVSKLGSTVLRVRPAEKGECWTCSVSPWEPEPLMHSGTVWPVHLRTFLSNPGRWLDQVAALG